MGGFPIVTIMIELEQWTMRSIKHYNKNGQNLPHKTYKKIGMKWVSISYTLELVGNDTRGTQILYTQVPIPTKYW